MASGTHEIKFNVNAQLGTQYNATFQSAQTALTTMQSEINELASLQKDISSYEKQQSAIDATTKRLELYQQQHDNIQKEIDETSGYSSKLQNQLAAKQAQIDKTATSLEGQNQKLGEMGTALQQAGVKTDDLKGSSAKLETQINELKEAQVEVAAESVEAGEAGESAVLTVQDALAAAGIVATIKEIYDAIADCVEIAGEFEASMSTVKALSGSTASEMGLLTEEAKNLGATTVYTSLEVADAMGYMGMAGWDATEMLSGMDAVLTLASASGEELANVSDIVTDNLTAFGLTAADTAEFADVLAVAATNSNTSVSIMGETFKNSASVAGALGYSVEDVAVAVGLMANSGVKGSTAGTALKNTFTGLLSGVTLTSEAFGEFEYTAVASDGTMKDLSTTIDELRVYFNQMTEAGRTNNAVTIAGERGFNGLLAILNSTTEDYDSLTTSIENSSGAAQAMADIKLDNTLGDLALMESAWDGLGTTIGETLLPEVSTLYELGANIFGGLNDFVEDYPELVRAGTAVIGVVSLATFGMTGYATATKVAVAANALFTSTIPGVNVIMGVTAAVAGLAAGYAILSTEADDAVPSVKELTEAARNMDDVMEGANGAFQTTYDSTIATANVADTYISKLEEMEAAGINTDEQAQEYHNTLALLCQVVPDLAEYIDLENDAIDGGTEALRANTQAWKENAIAQASQERLTALYSAHADVLIEAEENSIKLTEAEMNRAAVEAKQQELLERSNTLYAEATALATANREETGAAFEAVDYLTQEYYDLQGALTASNDEFALAQKAVENCEEAISDDAEAVEAAEKEIALCEQAVASLTDSTEDSTAAQEDFTEAMEETTESAWTAEDAIAAIVEAAAELRVAYDEAYDAAYDSVTGQYALWEEAEAVVTTSVGSITNAMESQSERWSDYNDNLSNLADRTDDVAGLADMIGSFADGSDESIAAIAGMAGATDEELIAMVESWQNLQAEQANVSASIADLATGFSDAMEDIADDIADVADIMDLRDEATLSAYNTVQGFIDGAIDQIPAVYSAYAQVGQAAVSAIDETLDIHSPSRVMEDRAHMSVDGYIGGATESIPDLKETMSDVAKAGMEAFSAGEAQIVGFAPQLMDAISSGGANAIPSSGETTIILEFAPVYHLSGATSGADVTAALSAHDAGLKDAILDILEEAGIDQARRSYR